MFPGQNHPPHFSARALTRLLEDRAFARAEVRSATVVARDAAGVTLRTWAVRENQRVLSSADLGQIAQTRTGVVAEIAGTWRVEAVGEAAFRFRYAEGDIVPENRTPMVVAEPSPPADLRIETTDHLVTLTTAAATLTLRLDNARVEIHDRRTGRLAAGISGPEKNNFHPWDTLATGICHATTDDRPIAVESFDLRPGEAIYGFGERFHRLDKVGQTIELEVDDALSVQSPRTYKCVPFMASTHGYGVFFNHHSFLACWVGSRAAADVQWAAADPFLDFYVFVGDLRTVLGLYTDLTGHAPDDLPAWTFGLRQSKNSYLSAGEVLAVARGMRAHGLPCDSIGLDTGWFKTNWWCDLEFGRENFPDPEGFLKELAAMGFKVALWQLPYIPEGSALFEELAAAGGFVKKKDGDVYNCGIAYIQGFRGVVGVIDYTNPAAVAIHQRYLRAALRRGAHSFKTDFGEQTPVDGVYHDNTPGERMKNLYPLLYNRAVAEVVEQETGTPFVWGRSTWAGSQRYPVQWGGDSSPLWSSLMPQITGGLSFGLSGFTYWSHDIGGFFGDKTDDALTMRWLQAGVLCSHPRIHGMGPQELWAFGPELLRIGRDWLQLRHRLLPYVRAEAAVAARAGLPLMRPLVLDSQDDPNVWRIDDQLLFGRALLAAPIYTPDGRRRVYLPAGCAWTDWWTRETLAGGRWMEVEHPLETMPLFVREGAVIPLGSVMNYHGERPETRLELLVAPFLADGETRLAVPVDDARTTVVYTATGGKHAVRTDGAPAGVEVTFTALDGRVLNG